MLWIALLAGYTLAAVLVGTVGYTRLRAKFLALDAQNRDLRNRVETIATKSPSRVRIVINSMPKVGSSSTLVTVACGLPHATVEPFHGITLPMQRILTQVIDEANNDWGRQTTHSHVCRMMEIRPELERLYNAHPQETGIYFITCTREPIGWALSTLFQLEEVGLVPRAQLEPDAARECIMKWLAGEPPCKYFPRPEDWFQLEIAEYLGVNPVVAGFDTSRGYQIYTSPRGPLLVVRNENLATLPDALSELLAAPRHLFQLARVNVTEEKQQGQLYKQVAATIRFPAEFVAAVYASPYATTFYSPAERALLASKWSA